jgi:hypothetical protein
MAVFAQDSRAETLRLIVTEVMRYGLEREGLKVSIAESVSPTGAVKDDSDLLRNAVEKQASVALSCRYSSNGTEVDLTVKWYDAQNGALVASTRKKGNVDLQFDIVILQTLEALLAQVGNTVKELTAVKSEAAGEQTLPPAEASNLAQPTSALTVTPGAAGAEAAAPGGAAVEAIPPGGATAGTAVQPVQPGGSSTAPEGSPVATQLPETPQQPGTGTREPVITGPALYMSAGFSPFFSLGAAADYFTLGYRAPVIAGFLFSTPVGGFGIGLYANLNYFLAQGIVETSQSFLAPFGPDLRYELDMGPLFSLHIHLSGGPALLILSTPSRGILGKVLPFGMGGIGMEIHIFPGLGIGLGADFEVFFETSYPIMGVSPSLTMSVRL